MKTINVVLSVWLFLIVFLVGVMVGMNVCEGAMQHDAVKAGVGRYEVDDTGHVTFTFNRERAC